MTVSKPNFDKALLTGPPAGRLQHFRTYVAKHQRLTSVDEQITAALREPAGAGFIFLVGPTGIGKSTIRDVIIRRFITEAMAEMLADPGFIPIAGIEIIASGHKSYDWHDHWTRALDALEEPLIKYKALPARSKIDRLTSGPRLREKTSALRRSFELASKLRRLLAFFLDEAQHLTHVPATLLRYQLETIKSVSNISKAVHVLMGTYELLLLRNASGQLGRRAVTIHFDRYQAKSDKDISAYAEVVQSFQLQMPLLETPDLLPHLEYCFERSLGCVGLLKDWFARALAEAVHKGAKTVTVRDLQRHELPPSVLLTISQEFVEGERRLFEEDTTFALLKERLGISARQRREVKKSPPAETGKGKPQNSNRRPGRRKPKRDKVGGGRTGMTQPASAAS
jgi:hypothetical protein